MWKLAGAGRYSVNVSAEPAHAKRGQIRRRVSRLFDNVGRKKRKTVNMPKQIAGHSRQAAEEIPERKKEKDSDSWKQLEFVSTLPVANITELTHHEDAPTYSNGIDYVMESMKWCETGVTVKRLHRSGRSEYTSEQLLDRLYKESERIGRLRHPRILLLLALCWSPGPGRFAIVFEQVERSSLYQLLHVENGHVSRRTLSVLLRQLCDALAFVHRRGFLHNALTSHAVQLVAPNVAKLSNFEHMIEATVDDAGISGISKQEERSRKFYSENSSSESLFNWVAPEVMRGKAPSRKSDIFSLSAIVWEVIHRRVPWHGLKAHEILRCSVDLGICLQCDPTFVSPFENILNGGLQQDASKRTSNVAAILYEMDTAFFSLACKTPGKSFAGSRCSSRKLPPPHSLRSRCHQRTKETTSLATGRDDPSISMNGQSLSILDSIDSQSPNGTDTRILGEQGKLNCAANIAPTTNNSNCSSFISKSINESKDIGSDYENKQFSRKILKKRSRGSLIPCISEKLLIVSTPLSSSPPNCTVKGTCEWCPENIQKNALTPQKNEILLNDAKELSELNETKLRRSPKQRKAPSPPVSSNNTAGLGSDLSEGFLNISEILKSAPNKLNNQDERELTYANGKTKENCTDVGEIFPEIGIVKEDLTLQEYDILEEINISTDEERALCQNEDLHWTSEENRDGDKNSINAIDENKLSQQKLEASSILQDPVSPITSTILELGQFNSYGMESPVESVVDMCSDTTSPVGDAQPINGLSPTAKSNKLSPNLQSSGGRRNNRVFPSVQKLVSAFESKIHASDCSSTIEGLTPVTSSLNRQVKSCNVDQEMPFPAPPPREKRLSAISNEAGNVRIPPAPVYYSTKYVVAPALEATPVAQSGEADGLCKTEKYLRTGNHPENLDCNDGSARESKCLIGEDMSIGKFSNTYITGKQFENTEYSIVNANELHNDLSKEINEINFDDTKINEYELKDSNWFGSSWTKIPRQNSTKEDILKKNLLKQSPQPKEIKKDNCLKMLESQLLPKPEEYLNNEESNCCTGESLPIISSEKHRNRLQKYMLLPRASAEKQTDNNVFVDKIGLTKTRLFPEKALLSTSPLNVDLSSHGQKKETMECLGSPSVGEINLDGSELAVYSLYTSPVDDQRDSGQHEIIPNEDKSSAEKIVHTQYNAQEERLCQRKKSLKKTSTCRLEVPDQFRQLADMEKRRSIVDQEELNILQSDEMYVNNSIQSRQFRNVMSNNTFTLSNSDVEQEIMAVDSESQEELGSILANPIGLDVSAESKKRFRSKLFKAKLLDNFYDFKKKPKKYFSLSSFVDNNNHLGKAVANHKSLPTTQYVDELYTMPKDLSSNDLVQENILKINRNY